MLKMKFALLLILLLFIVDCKKLRIKLKKKTSCNGKDAKCGWFRANYCKFFECIAAFGMFGYCV